MCCAWILLRINWEQLCDLPRGLRGKKKSRSPHFSSKSKVTEACQSTGVLSDQGAVQRKAGKALIMGHLGAGKWLGMRAGPRPSQGTDGKSGPLYVTRWTFSPVLPSHPLGLGKMQPCSNDGISQCRKLWAWKPSYNFAMECSSLSKALGGLGRGGLFSLTFKERSWLEEAGGVSNRVTGRKFSHFSLNQSQWWAHVPVVVAAGKNGSTQT